MTTVRKPLQNERRGAMPGKKIAIVLFCILECAILSFAFINPVRVNAVYGNRIAPESETTGVPCSSAQSGGVFTQIDLSCNEFTVFHLLRKAQPSDSREADSQFLFAFAIFGPATAFTMRCARQKDKPVFARDLNSIIEFLLIKDWMK